MKMSNVVIRYLLLMTIFFTVIMFSGCAAIEGIFKAGVWTGVIIIVIILAIVFWLMSKFRK